MVLPERALLAVAAALLAVLAWGLAVGSGLGWVTRWGRLLRVAALLPIASLLAVGVLLPIGALLGISALIVTAWLCGGIAGRRIGGRRSNRLHRVAGRHLGVAVVALPIP